MTSQRLLLPEEISRILSQNHSSFFIMLLWLKEGVVYSNKRQDKMATATETMLASSSSSKGDETDINKDDREIKRQEKLKKLRELHLKRVRTKKQV